MINCKRIFIKFKSFFLIFVLFLVNLIFFFYLFLPENKLIITPEYGGGDISIFHYPIKYNLQQDLRSQKFSLWSEKIGGGYPIYAQGEVGFFDPINLLTLYLLPFALAINVQTFLYFYILLLGTYYFAKQLKLGTTASIFASITFSYSFFNIANIIHLSHLSSFCYLPLIISFLLKIFNENKIKIINYLIFIVFLSLQTVSGHPQYLFYSYLFIFLTILFYFFKKNKVDSLFKDKIILFIIYFIFYLGLVSFYLLPTIEYFWNSNRDIVANTNKFNTSLTFGDLLTFFSPFIKYDISLNIKTFGKFLPPWDGNLFIGFGSVILFLTIFIFKSLRKKYFLFFKKNYILLFFLTAIFLIALGDNSPLYFLMTSFPFSLFRVPSRILFICLMIFSLSLAYIFNYIWLKKKRHRGFLMIILFFNFFSSLYLMYQFNLFTNEKDFFKENKLINYLKKNLANSRFVSIYFYEEYLPYLLYKKGINKLLFDDIDIQKHSLPLNLGVIFGLNNFNLPTPAHNLKRHYYFYNLFYENDDKNGDSFEKRYESRKVYLNDEKLNLLRISSIKFIVSPYKLIVNDDQKKIKLINYFNLNKENNIYLYEIKNPYNKIYLTNKLKYVRTLKEFKNNLKDLEKNEAIVEDRNIALKINNQKKYSANILSYHNAGIIKKIFLTNNEDVFLVINENFYPNWKAYLNNKKIKIYKTNLNGMGFFIPKDAKNEITLKFEPDLLFLGFKISTLALITLISFTIFLMRFPQFFLTPHSR